MKYTNYDQTIYKNQTLINNLQQAAQETNPLSTITSPGSQTTVKQSCRKQARLQSLVTLQKVKHKLL